MGCQVWNECALQLEGGQFGPAMFDLRLAGCDRPGEWSPGHSKRGLAMSKEKSGTWAPRKSQLSSGSKEGIGNVSFEAYFLRDLYSRGKVDDKLVAEIIAQNKLQANAADVIAALKDNSGSSIPRGLANIISDIAAIVADCN